MSALNFAFRFVVANVFTLVAGFLGFILLAWNYVNPFANPWPIKLRLEPPASLTDPKYGVHKYIKVNNTKLHYVESGDQSKPLMIFVHGYPEFWYSWRYQIVEYQKKYWCVAVDMRGYGDSEKPDGVSSYKMELLVDDLRDLIRQLGREKAILVSHDWGGLVTCHFRDTYPEALLAVVMLGTTSKKVWNDLVWSNLEQFFKSWYVFMFRIPDLAEKLSKMNDLELFDRAMLVEGKNTVTKQDLECYKYWFGKPLALTPPINYYRANFSYTVAPKKRCEKRIPFLYLLGQKDLYISTKSIDRMKEHYAFIEAEVVENCRHFLQQEEPEKINKLMTDFFNRHGI